MSWNIVRSFSSIGSWVYEDVIIDLFDNQSIHVSLYCRLVRIDENNVIRGVFRLSAFEHGTRKRINLSNDTDIIAVELPGLGDMNVHSAKKQSIVKKMLCDIVPRVHNQVKKLTIRSTKVNVILENKTLDDIEILTTSEKTLSCNLAYYMEKIIDIENISILPWKKIKPIYRLVAEPFCSSSYWTNNDGTFYRFMFDLQDPKLPSIVGFLKKEALFDSENVKMNSGKYYEVSYCI